MRGFLATVLGVAAGTAFGWILLGVAGLGMLGSGWDSFVRFGVADDLQELRQGIRDARVDPVAGTALRARVGELRVRVANGELELGLLEWIPHDNVFEDALVDGVLDAEEIREIHAELDLIERQ